MRIGDESLFQKTTQRPDSHFGGSGSGPCVAAPALWGAEAGREVQVIRDGTVVAQYDLGVDQTIRLENGQGGYNILVITEGYADITEASCPDKVCVEQRAISRAGEAITCLPNKTVISIVGDSGVDVVA